MNNDMWDQALRSLSLFFLYTSRFCASPYHYCTYFTFICVYDFYLLMHFMTLPLTIWPYASHNESQKYVLVSFSIKFTRKIEGLSIFFICEKIMNFGLAAYKIPFFWF